MPRTAGSLRRATGRWLNRTARLCVRSTPTTGWIRGISNERSAPSSTIRSVAFASTWLRTFGSESRDWTPECCDLATLLTENTVLTAALVRREALLAVGGYDSAMPEQGDEDWDLWLTLVECGCTGVIIPEVLFYYRRRERTMSSHCWHGPGHLPLARYRIAKHRRAYEAHLFDVLLRQDAETAALLRCNDELSAASRPSSSRPYRFGARSSRRCAVALRKQILGARVDELSAALHSATAEVAALRGRRAAGSRAASHRLRLAVACERLGAMRKRIAAMITCRDLGRFIDEALASIERQTRVPAEILIVDDGSSDLYTRQALARLAGGGTAVVSGDGRGASAARNLAARLTTADYLVWLDADDVLEPRNFELAAGRLDADDQIDFVSCPMRAFGAASMSGRRRLRRSSMRSVPAACHTPRR